MNINMFRHIYIYIYRYERLSLRFMSKKHKAAGENWVGNDHNMNCKRFRPPADPSLPRASMSICICIYVYVYRAH